MNKVYSQRSSVPFSWEDEPGVAKGTTNEEQEWPSRSLRLLPPPPCPKDTARVSLHPIQIPLPPCAFRPAPSRSYFKKGLQQDPFFVAFTECTKTTTTTKSKLLPKSTSSNNKKGIFNFSCRHSCSVVDDNLVKISRLPSKKDEER